jgi:hypothetical protein
LAEHWNSKYKETEYSNLGWHENVPSSSIGMLEESGIEKTAHIFISGSGTSFFVDKLLQNGFSNITVTDISKSAVDQLKKRLGSLSDKVTWLVGDILDDNIVEQIRAVEYWHDRAVLHFLTKEEERQKYFKIVNEKVKGGGYVMLAQFDENEFATKCSNLPVFRYSLEMYKEGLGGRFEAIKSFQEIYSMPSGDFRNYLFGLFRKMN